MSHGESIPGFGPAWRKVKSDPKWNWDSGNIAYSSERELGNSAYWAGDMSGNIVFVWNTQ